MESTMNDGPPQQADNKDNRRRTGNTVSSPQSNLRRQAEARLRASEDLPPEMLDPQKIRQSLHELRVHQIELEIQNEELRRFQQELETSQERYRDLYDFAPVGYMTVSAEGVILEANQTAATLLNVAADTLTGLPFPRFILPDDQDIYYHHRAAIFETDEPQSCKLRLLRTEHPAFWARLETAPAKNFGQAPSVCRIMLSDISEGVRLDTEKKQLEMRYQQLQKAESLGRMAGAIAHHFNNLLGVVIGNLEFIMPDMPEGNRSHEFLSSAMDAARRASEVSGSMLTYLGHTLGKHEPLDLSATCFAILPRLRAVIPKDVELMVDFPAGGPTINANAYQMQQVLKNMVTNAWEARNNGRNAIHLRVKKVAPGDIPASHRFPVDWQPQEGFYACLTVTDSGSGIDMVDLEKIFDPFFTSRFLGRGLGLSIVLGIVRAHNGVVTVESKMGQGSIFSVFLPVYAGEVPVRMHRTIEVPQSSRGCTVLVVDDEPMLCDIAKAVLERMDFAVLVARNGSEAVEIFQQHREAICCVLCDLVMPGMDGWQTLTALRRLAPDLPVILSSGYDQVQVMADDHPDLPQYFLGKPYNLAGLQEAIREVLTNSVTTLSKGSTS
jgi:PAS domain S-box-containing protein